MLKMLIFQLHNAQFSPAFPSTLSSSFLVSRPTRSVDVEKLFCCLFVMMDEGSQLCFFSFFCLTSFIFEAALDTLVHFMGKVQAVFVTSHHWLRLGSVALSALLLPARIIHQKQQYSASVTRPALADARLHCASVC